MEVSVNIPSILDVKMLRSTKRMSAELFLDIREPSAEAQRNRRGYRVCRQQRRPLFATLKLKLNNYAAENTTVTLRVDYVTAEGVDAAFNVSSATASIPLVKPENNALRSCWATPTR